MGLHLKPGFFNWVCYNYLLQYLVRIPTSLMFSMVIYYHFYLEKKWLEKLVSTIFYDYVGVRVCDNSTNKL